VATSLPCACKRRAVRGKKRECNYRMPRVEPDRANWDAPLYDGAISSYRPSSHANASFTVILSPQAKNLAPNLATAALLVTAAPDSSPAGRE
jgi:hypothetical protein